MNKSMIINLLQSGKDQLQRTFEATPDDKLHWRPLDQGRSVIDLAGDAAQTPGMATKILHLTPDATLPPLGEMFGQMGEERAAWGRAEVIQHLETNHAALISAIEGLSNEELARPLSLVMRGDFSLTFPLAGWAMLAYRTYLSRFGQINYIQTLYGDTAGH